MVNTGRNVLVTGHSGFTGRYVSQLLRERGYRVIGLGGHPAGAAECDDFITADLRDPDATRRALDFMQVDAAIHLAAISFVGHGDIRAIYDVNVVGTRNLLSALHQSQSSGLRSVIVASSANVYGNMDSDAIQETRIPRPENDYAVSKVAMEHVARIWSDKLPITVLRPFNYSGVGQAPQFLIPKIVSHFAGRKPQIELGNTEVWRDFSDVRGIARVYLDLLEADTSGETFNFCSGHPLSISEIIEIMSEFAGYEIDVSVNPDFVRSNEIRRLAGDPSKLESTIGDQFHIPFRETLKWMYENEVSLAKSAAY